MARESTDDLRAFVAVARERSFTRAAARLGVSPSALSHAMRALEQRLGLRLLSRTTRSVAPTEAGERLLRTVAPHIDEIDAELAALRELRDEAVGTIRITATDYAADTILWPRLSAVLPAHPGLKIDMVIDYGLVDIVADRFDIGVRGGDQVAKDMVAVRIAPDRRFVVVGAPAYLARQAPPVVPKDLLSHRCINLRLPTHGALYAWEFRKGRREMQVRVDGQVTVNGTYQKLQAALGGLGLAYLPEDLAAPYIASGRLRQVLADWSPTFPGLHLFYASRRSHSRALSVVVEALREPA